MNPKRENSESGAKRFPLPAVYRQLDDHPGETETPYDVTAGLEQLMVWMGEEVPTAQPARDLHEVPEAELLQGRVSFPQSDTARLAFAEHHWLLTRELARQQTRSAHRIFATVAILGILAAGLLVVVPHPERSVHVRTAIIGLVTFAGVYLHRMTMEPLRVHLNLARERRTSDREVAEEAERQPVRSESVVDDVVEHSPTSEQGRLDSWTSRRVLVPGSAGELGGSRVSRSS